MSSEQIKVPVRSPADFQFSRGEPPYSRPNIHEAICILVATVLPDIEQGFRHEAGPPDERRIVTGSDVTSACRELLSKSEKREHLAELVAQTMLPALSEALARLGYAGIRVNEERDAEEVGWD